MTLTLHTVTFKVSGPNNVVAVNNTAAVIPFKVQICFAMIH